MTAVAAVVTASSEDAETANRIESAWSKLKGPLQDMMPPKFVISPRRTSRDQKPGDGMKRWIKLYERGEHGSKFSALKMGGMRPRRQKCLH